MPSAIGRSPQGLGCCDATSEAAAAAAFAASSLIRGAENDSAGRISALAKKTQEVAATWLWKCLLATRRSAASVLPLLPVAVMALGGRLLSGGLRTAYCCLVLSRL